MNAPRIVHVMNEVSALPDVPLSMGVNRAAPRVAITQLLGDPRETQAGEGEVRRPVRRTAGEAPTTEVGAPRLFALRAGAEGR
jgi:hypothetical protein